MCDSFVAAGRTRFGIRIRRRVPARRAQRHAPAVCGEAALCERTRVAADERGFRFDAEFAAREEGGNFVRPAQAVDGERQHQFVVGGDVTAIRAKARLREIALEGVQP